VLRRLRSRQDHFAGMARELACPAPADHCRAAIGVRERTDLPSACPYGACFAEVMGRGSRRHSTGLHQRHRTLVNQTLYPAVTDPCSYDSASTASHGVALIVMALMLNACSKAPSDATPPLTMPAQAASAPATSSGPDPSVPDASSVLTPGTAPRADAAAGRTNGSMTPAQESGAMPLPGQNNDHSAPQAPARRASGP
jgi:hypothetical protein